VTCPTIDPAVPLVSPPFTERRSRRGVRLASANALIFSVDLVSVTVWFNTRKMLDNCDGVQLVDSAIGYECYMQPVDSDEPSPTNTCCFLFAFNDAMFFDLSKASVIIMCDLSFQR
jgi:hypothetical protein